MRGMRRAEIVEGERDLKKWCNGQRKERRNREAFWAMAAEQGRAGWPWCYAVRDFGFGCE